MSLTNFFQVKTVYENNGRKELIKTNILAENSNNPSYFTFETATIDGAITSQNVTDNILFYDNKIKKHPADASQSPSVVVSNITNISTVTFENIAYQKIGNWVFGYARFMINGVVQNAECSFDFSIPVESNSTNTFTSESEAWGTIQAFGLTTYPLGYIEGIIGTQNIRCYLNNPFSTNPTPEILRFEYNYIIP